ncbi:hypothetical protein SETIT_2G432300v2 [Setaria italica]|uniref:Uncharacterized protein n=1 Tax=Setaria italica TaxID=4555 RepID=A0A368Q9H0_SETIT|nr:hypothetical protein SETIT_2G432300v2 [Setaria italica]
MTRRRRRGPRRGPCRAPRRSGPPAARTPGTGASPSSTAAPPRPSGPSLSAPPPASPSGASRSSGTPPPRRRPPRHAGRWLWPPRVPPRQCCSPWPQPSGPAAAVPPSASTLEAVVDAVAPGVSLSRDGDGARAPTLPSVEALGGRESTAAVSLRASASERMDMSGQKTARTELKLLKVLFPSNNQIGRRKSQK